MSALLLCAMLTYFADAVPFSIGGTAAPHESVTITIDPHPPLTATADADGRWSAEWTVPLPTGVYAVRFRSGDVVTDALVRVQLRGRLPRQPHVTVEPAPVARPFVDSAENVEVTSRWRIAPPPYELDEHSRGPLDPYNRNLWKGDYPIRGNDTFLVLTGVSDSLAEARSDAGLVAQNIVLAADLYRGLTTFRPVEQRVKLTVVAAARQSADATRGRVSVQELFYERKLRDLSVNYDFVSLRAGSQPFVSDFRGFIFADTNLGVRLFGNYASNRYQFNVAVFDRLAKEKGTALNRFESLRNQIVGVANFYWQDFLRPGYTQQFSIHRLRDEDLEATYLGAAGFGSAGRFNVEHAAYYVTGRDRGHSVGAWMAAAELSQQRDWLRPRIGVLHASDGFDSIYDATTFAGGGFSYFSRLGNAVVERGSLFPSARREEGRPNYDNEGLQLITVGADVDLTPRWKAILTASHLRDIGTDISVASRYRPFLNNHVVLIGGVAMLLPDNDYHAFTNVVLQF